MCFAFPQDATEDLQQQGVGWSLMGDSAEVSRMGGSRFLRGVLGRTQCPSLPPAAALASPISPDFTLLLSPGILTSYPLIQLLSFSNADNLREPPWRLSFLVSKMGIINNLSTSENDYKDKVRCMLIKHFVNCKVCKCQVL